MKNILLFGVIFLLKIQNATAQRIDNQSLAKDSTPSVVSSKQLAVGNKQDSAKPKSKPLLVKTKLQNDSFPSPRKALLYSIIPGGGQIYNRKLWFIKLPIVYGGFAFGGYLIGFNGDQYSQFREAYSRRVNGLAIDNPKIPEYVTTQRLKEIRDGAYKALQESYVFTAVWYILTAAEAFTAAHLAHFDVRDDLSFRLKPSFEPVGGNAVGIGIQMRF